MSRWTESWTTGCPSSVYHGASNRPLPWFIITIAHTAWQCAQGPLGHMPVARGNLQGLVGAFFWRSALELASSVPIPVMLQILRQKSDVFVQRPLAAKQATARWMNSKYGHKLNMVSAKEECRTKHTRPNDVPFDASKGIALKTNLFLFFFGAGNETVHTE